MLSQVRIERAFLKEDGDLPSGAGGSTVPTSVHERGQNPSDSRIMPTVLRPGIVEHVTELGILDNDIAVLNQGGRRLAEAIEGLTKLESPLSAKARLPIEIVLQQPESLDTGLSRYLIALTAHHFDLEEGRSNLLKLPDVRDAYEAPMKARALVETVTGLGEQFGRSLFTVASEHINLRIQNNSLVENIHSLLNWVSSDVCGSPWRRPALTPLQLLAGSVISDTRQRVNEHVEAICKSYESDTEKGMQDVLLRGGFEMSMADALLDSFEKQRRSVDLPSGRTWTKWNEAALNKLRSGLVDGVVPEALSQVFDLEVRSKIAQLHLHKLAQKVVGVANEAERLDSLHTRLFGAPSPDLAELPETFYKKVLQAQPRGWQRTAYSLEELRTIEPDGFALLRRLATGLRLDNPRP